MPLLLLDPLVLLLAAVVVLYTTLVWRGGFRAWFGRTRLWWWCWPLPLVAVGVPLLVGPLVRVLTARLAGEGGGVPGVTLYLALNVVPIAWLGLLPPRWLLPPWARTRIARPPVHEEPPVAGAVPAVHAWGPRNGQGPPRWRWRVDGVPGHAWVEDGRHLRFRAGPDTAQGTELDQSEIDQLDLHLGDDAGLRPPRGGWWTRRLLDVDLAAVDHTAVRARRPWDAAGLLRLEVTGRAPLHLWVADADALDGLPVPDASRGPR